MSTPVKCFVCGGTTNKTNRDFRSYRVKGQLVRKPVHTNPVDCNKK